MSKLDREDRAVDKRPGSVADLVSEKEESECTSAHEVSSSSGESSPEEFQEEQRKLRLFLPPGAALWLRFLAAFKVEDASLGTTRV